jgi:ElaB/YqjD/DUF883 family membrane-anchored ribosome-binding protein
MQATAGLTATDPEFPQPTIRTTQMNPSTSTPNASLDGTRQAVTDITNQAAHTADNAIRGTQRMANDAADSMSNKVKELSAEAGPALSRATEQASAMAHRGIDAVRQGTQQLRESADQASTRTIGYIKDEPLKAMLIAGATGAVLMALLSLLNQSRHRA